MTSMTAPITAAFAVSTSWRLGTAANVTRINPVENSLVTASTPRVPVSNWPSTSEMKLSWVGSKTARSAAPRWA